jgi:hypothetical protein
MLRELQASARAWLDAGRPNSRLLSDDRLRAARAWVAAHPDELQEGEVRFVKESHRLDRRATLFAIAVGVLVLLGIIVWRQFRAPEPYATAVTEPFLVTDNRKPDADRWDYPESWQIVPGEGSTTADGALLVEGSSLGVLKANAIYDFTASFKLRILKGTRAAWAFRVQSDRRRYYLFEIEPSFKSVQVRGTLVGAGGASALSNGTQPLSLADCCRADDGYRVEARIQGNEFRFSVTVDPLAGGTGDFAPYYGRTVRFEPMRDPENSYRYGSIGFLAEGGSQVRIEYLELTELGPRSR